MQFTFTLSLPSEALSVPLARHLTRQSLVELGVEGTCTDAIELALSEACANVLRHADSGEVYEIRLEIDDHRCAMRITDTGRGFDPDRVAEEARGSLAEGGRGLGLMGDLVDLLHVESCVDDGTEVLLEKDLSFLPEAVLPRLTGSAPTPADG